MGNKVPKECNMGKKLRCCKCNKVLPPCKSFDDFHKSEIRGQLIYVFNGGEYYRPVGHNELYECEYCFNEPIRVQENIRRQEREERRRQEVAQQRREEERRMREEEKRKEEERKWREEQWRREEERKRIEEQLRREQERKWREEQRRREKVAQQRREEERKMREEKKRREEERKRREEQRRIEKIRKWIKEEMRKKEERKWREEQRRIEEEKKRREEEMRREEERKRREEDIRREEERKRREEEMRKEEERKWREEQRRREKVAQQRREEERKMREEERRREEERMRREVQRRIEKIRKWIEEEMRKKEERKWREEQRRIEEERKRREEEMRREEERKRREVQRRIEQIRKWIDEEKRREEERNRREVQRRIEKIRKWVEEEKRREEEIKRREEEIRREEERKRREEEMRTEDERKRREEEMRTEEERKRREEEMRTEEEKKRREEEMRTEEERKRREEEMRTEEGRLREKVNQRLQESHQRAKEHFENQLSIHISQEYKCKQDVLIGRLDEFEANYESDSDSDDFQEILSSKCSIEVSNLSLSQLTADQLGEILSLLDKLLFDEWISALPSISTLQHTQVFITELCALSLEISEDASQQSISNHVQFLVESISQSACGVFESFLLTQALYLNLMHFFNNSGSSDSDAVLIAKQWAEYELSTENLFVIEFLSTLTSSLQSTVGRASVFILKMEIQCLKLLLSTLTHLHGKEAHSQSTEILLKLVQTNQWTPMEAVTLLKALSQIYADDVSIIEVLTLVQMYDISPDWTDKCGSSIIQVLESASPERFHQDFQKTLRGKDESSLTAALAEVKMLWNLDDSFIDTIKTITTGVLQHTENAPKEELLMKDSFKGETMNADSIQKCLSQLCKAVFDIKGWWPTVRQMVRWCALMETQKSRVLQLVGVEEDPCVTAMFAATQVCMGNKLDIVLSADVHPEERTKEWSEFYKHLNISVNTNMKKTNPSFQDVYEADIVYGAMDDFVSDYFQRGIEAMETGNPQVSRGFIIEKQSLSASHNLELSVLKDNDSLVFAAEVLQNLMNEFHSEDVELRTMFIKTLFLLLQNNLNKVTITNSKIITITKKMTRKEFPSNKVFILIFLETLLQVLTRETEVDRNFGKWCLRILFSCVEQFQDSKEETTEVFKMVSNLLSLWLPVEALNLLGELINHHHDDGCISIMKILHLMETFQVSNKWTDDNDKSLLELIDSFTTKKMIQHLQKSLKEEETKSIDNLFDEIRQMKEIDEQILNKSYNIVTYVTNLIKNKKIKNHTNIQKARTLSQSMEVDDLQEILAVLCNAVHLHKAEKKWWPRTTQMISWCLLALSDTGKLLEMGTGEGKSCVIAMFAVLRVLRGEKVDVVSSSSLLCQRDAKEWTEFYKYFGITVDINTNKTDDEHRKACYQKDVVYGTIEAFAADHLRQIFEMKDVRPDRSFQCIIIDEVDSLLLDQGVQLTYLSSPMVSMQHLNIILTMIWSHVCQYGFLSTGRQTFVRGPSVSFFKAIYDSMNTEESEITDPMDILSIAEESNIVPKGFTEDFYKSEKDELLRKLKTVSQDAMVAFFHEIENYVPYGFTVYTLNDKGLLCLQKCSPYNDHDVPTLSFLVLEEGLCCPLYESEEILIKPIAELISERIQYTPCENNKDKISIPGFLKKLVEKKVSVWVQNAFLAMQLKQGREYVVENDNVCPVDFRSTGIVELNKKWGDGLQQFVEIKHQVKLSTISTVTNYISNISFFEKYQGKLYGTTGTLGNKEDIQFLQDLYPNLSACKIPTFNRKKLFEVNGILKRTAEEWKSEIKQVVMDQISPNSYRNGRAALVICETINKANEIYEELKSSIPGEIILYCRSDSDSLSKIDKELLPGDVIVATNLAGRGTDIQVSTEVNNNGGLFVILSFLSENTRVELQAFGRTARKGKPGSAQVIISTEHLQQAFSTVSSLEEAKNTRDQLAAEKINHVMNDVAEMKLREDLFSEYCVTLQDIYKTTDGDDQRAVVAIMNEFWGIWLQTKSEEIDQLKRNELQESLKADLSKAKSQSQHQTSPCSSIYHYIKFGNIALDEKKWDVAARLFEKAMKQDESWAAIAFYNHAYCTIQQKNTDYLTKAREDLEKAQESLKFLNEELIVCLQFVKMSSADSANSNPTSLEKQLTTKCDTFGYLDKNISEAIQKLDEVKERGRDAVAKKSPFFSLVSGEDEDLQIEAYNLYSRGLQYVFTVEEEPRFSWEGLLVFLLGVLQIVGGVLLIVYTCGAFALFGMELIIEGISDCIYGIKSMVTGEFSWKEWAIEKAISIGVSLIGFGVGKLISKGFKCFKSVLKFGKQLKAMPAFLSKQAKSGVSVALKANLKNAVNHTGKTIVEEIITYGLGTAEDEIIKKIVDDIKNKVKENIDHNVKLKIQKEPSSALIDLIILSQLEDKKQLHDLLKNEHRKKELLAVFKELSKTAIQPFYADLSWQSKLNSSLSSVIQKAKAHTKGKASLILTAIQVGHMGTLAGDAIGSVVTLSDKFFSNFHEQLNKYKETQKHSGNINVSDLSDGDIELLKAFKQDLANTISASLADALVEVFHQKFSSHIVSHIKGQLNGVFSHYIRKDLKSDRTEEKLRAGQNNNYVAYMPRNLKSKHKVEGEADQCSRSHSEKIKNPMTPGTILDIRVLSEATGTKVIILTEDSSKKLTKMQELNPDTGPTNKTVTLIYRPKSAQYPDGHYDVQINNQTVIIDSIGNSCLFQALARGMKPEASEEEISLEAHRLRSVEADALLRHPGQWEPFIKRKELTEAIRGGDWYMLRGAAIKESKNSLQKHVGKQQSYREAKNFSRRKANKGVGKFMNADHQPAVSSIKEAKNFNQNSRLAKAMLEVATNSSTVDISDVQKYHGLELPTVYVPTEVHREFPSTTSPAFRKHLATTISKDDIVGSFKLMILGSMPRFWLNSNKNFKNFQNTPMSKTRFDVFKESFQKHSTEMVKAWFSPLQSKGVMTNDHLTTITDWINRQGYIDQNDPHRNEVADLL